MNNVPVKVEQINEYLISDKSLMTQAMLPSAFFGRAWIGQD